MARMNEAAIREHALKVIKGTAEPVLTEYNYRTLLIEYLNYHNSLSSDKDKRIWLNKFLTAHNLLKFIPILEKASDYEIRQIGPLCRAKTSGMYISTAHNKFIEVTIRALLAKYSNPKIKVVDSTVKVISAEEKQTAIYRELAGQLDEQIDTFSTNKQSTFSMKTFIAENKISESILKRLEVFLTAKMSEITKAVTGTDTQLVEGYSNFSKVELKRFLMFLITAVKACIYVPPVKVSKPRKVKVVPKETIIKNLKYRKDFPELRLKSVDPMNIIGATELWAYDTGRTLVHYIAEAGKVFSVKGTTILNFDEKKSFGKNIRKPPEFFASLIMAKAAFKKTFDAISATPKALSGRLNSEMILLKVF